MSYVVGFPSALKALASAKTAKVAMETSAEVIDFRRFMKILVLMAIMPTSAH